jgi:hypothetical protein
MWFEVQIEAKQTLKCWLLLVKEKLSESLLSGQWKTKAV